MKGSWTVLAGLALVFGACFTGLRANSDFLAVEAERDQVAAAARAHGVPMAEALALRLVLGVDKPVSEFDWFCQRYAELKPLLGAPLAVVELTGDPTTARAAVRARAGDTEAAWQHVWGQPEVVEGVKFLSWRDRYAKRDSARALD